MSVAALAAAVAPVDEAAAGAARARHDLLAKPPGSLGALEEVGARLAAVAGRCPPPPIRRPVLVVAAADHGVHRHGVSAWPREVTAAVVDAVAHGGAVAPALAATAGAELVVLDVGVAGPVRPGPRLVERRVRAGTADLAVADAMTADETARAVTAGAEVVAALVAGGADAVLLGDVGMANTTATAALVGALTGTPAAAVTGRGAGADDDALDRKRAVVARALARVEGRSDPLDLLAAVGGLEHAALAGAALAAAAHRVPVLVDGAITLAAALVAARLRPALAGHLLAAHRPAEPAGRLALDALGLDPLLDLGLRLGEGSGALLALPLVRAAAAVLADVALLADLA